MENSGLSAEDMYRLSNLSRCRVCGQPIRSYKRRVYCSAECSAAYHAGLQREIQRRKRVDRVQRVGRGRRGRPKNADLTRRMEFESLRLYDFLLREFRDGEEFSKSLVAERGYDMAGLDTPRYFHYWTRIVRILTKLGAIIPVGRYAPGGYEMKGHNYKLRVDPELIAYYDSEFSVDERRSYAPFGETGKTYVLKRDRSPDWDDKGEDDGGS